MTDKPKKAKCPADKLTREYLKAGGYVVDKAESYNAIIKRKKDLFGFIDYMAIHPIKKTILAVQTTSKSNLSTRIKKAEGLPAYWHWLRTGSKVAFHGWYKEAGMWRLKEIIKDGSKSDLF